MRHIGRLFLVLLAIFVGGISGYELLPGFDPGNIIMFAVICLILGELFYQIDMRMSKH